MASLRYLILLALIYQTCGEECPAKKGQVSPKEEAIETVELGDLILTIDGAEINLELKSGSDGGNLLNGFLALDLPAVLGTAEDCSAENPDKVCRNWGSAAQFSVERTAENRCYDVSWSTRILRSHRDCFDIGTESNTKWFGGPEEYYQHFPLNASFTRETVPYLPGDMLQDKEMYFGGVAEPYWLSSKGVAIWVPEGVPLFYSWNNDRNPGQLCMESKAEPPYVLSEDGDIKLNYKICSHSDPKAMHMFAIDQFLGKPTGIPDEEMIKHPIWSSWAQYKADINQSTILDFARQIRENGFEASQLEIDDNWEVCYGDAEFDTGSGKFPDPGGMIKQIKEDYGFRVTLWIHPFVNLDCKSWLEAAIPPKSYFVRDTKGKKDDGVVPVYGQLPGLVWWWQGVLASYVDYTNPEAVKWWSDRLEKLRADYGIDSFKFDAGEVNWLPSSFLFNETYDESLWPAVQTTSYVDAVSKFGPMIEVRVGRRTQKYPIFVRMLDKDSNWGYNNGLKTLVTTLLQMSMVGYPFVLPDMIGGNGYSDDPLHESEAPEVELYIRWFQANIFMPSMQFSFVPWQYEDPEPLIEHVKDLLDFRFSLSDYIIKLANEATKTGEPINRPIWWLDPTDETAFGIDSEFLLGNDYLVAPVLEKGARSRNIYLPKGSWLDMKDNSVHEGPIWLEDYAADLYELPWFTKM